MTTFIFSAIYLAFGFFFMTSCAKFGWMDKYDPPFFYWFCWPVIILVACLRVVTNSIATVNSVLENYVNTLKPKQHDNA